MGDRNRNLKDLVDQILPDGPELAEMVSVKVAVATLYTLGYMHGEMEIHNNRDRAENCVAPHKRWARFLPNGRGVHT